MKAEGAYAVAPPSTSSGHPYQFVDGALQPETLSKQLLLMLIAALKKKGRAIGSSGTGNTGHTGKNWIFEIISLIKPCYHLGLRNDLVMCLSGLLRKEGITINDAREIIEGICKEDEEKAARIRTLEETYRKDDFNDLKGYSGLVRIFVGEVGEIQAYKLLDQLQSFVQSGKQEDSNQQSEVSQGIIEEASKTILSEHRFLTLEETREIWYYRGGVYVPGGEILIEKEAERIYGYNIANRHLSEIKGHITRSTYHTREEIDSDLNIINLKNGLYDIRTGGFNQHSPDHLSINQLPVLYDPTAKPKLFGKFLREVLYPSEIRTAIELMAYTIYRDNPFELITILFGYGANGKNVFSGLLTTVHGAKTSGMFHSQPCLTISLRSQTLRISLSTLTLN